MGFNRWRIRDMLQAIKHVYQNLAGQTLKERKSLGSLVLGAVCTLIHRGMLQRLPDTGNEARLLRYCGRMVYDPQRLKHFSCYDHGFYALADIADIDGMFMFPYYSPKVDDEVLLDLYKKPSLRSLAESIKVAAPVVTGNGKARVPRGPRPNVSAAAEIARTVENGLENVEVPQVPLPAVAQPDPGADRNLGDETYPRTQEAFREMLLAAVTAFTRNCIASIPDATNGEPYYVMDGEDVAKADSSVFRTTNLAPVLSRAVVRGAKPDQWLNIITLFAPDSGAPTASWTQNYNQYGYLQIYRILMEHQSNDVRRQIRDFFRRFLNELTWLPWATKGKVWNTNTKLDGQARWRVKGRALGPAPWIAFKNYSDVPRCVVKDDLDAQEAEAEGPDRGSRASSVATTVLQHVIDHRTAQERMYQDAGHIAARASLTPRLV